MANAEIVRELRNANLVATCSHCACNFDLSKAVLFDGLGEFPDVAQQKRDELLAGLQDRVELYGGEGCRPKRFLQDTSGNLTGDFCRW